MRRRLAAAFLVVLAAVFFAVVLPVAVLAVALAVVPDFLAVFFAGDLRGVVALVAVALVVFFAGVRLAAFLAVLGDAVFLAAPRVAPPRPRRLTPDSFNTLWTNPYERPASSAILRMLSPPEYRLAYWDASEVRCVPLIREPLASVALATASSLSRRRRRPARRRVPHQ